MPAVRDVVMWPYDATQRAVHWLAGLRISTRAQRAEDNAMMDMALRQAKHQERKATQAAAAQRNAERVLVILAEPLKDWDLADFTSVGVDGTRHLEAIRDAYRTVAPEAARIRMGRKVSDRMRGTGFDDQPIRRYLP